MPIPGPLNSTSNPVIVIRAFDSGACFPPPGISVLICRQRLRPFLPVHYRPVCITTSSHDTKPPIIVPTKEPIERPLSHFLQRPVEQQRRTEP